MRLLRIRFTHIEPIWWGLFGAGGVLAALVLPGLLVLVILSGWLVPLDLSRMPITGGAFVLRCSLHLLVALLLFHAGHRIYHGLHDLMLPRGLVAKALTYGLAILYSVLALLDLAGLPRLIFG